MTRRLVSESKHRRGPRTRLPKVLYHLEKKWHMASKSDPRLSRCATWRRNCSLIEAMKDEVLEALRDQASRGHVLVLTEEEAERRYPDLVVVSLGVMRKDKPHGEKASSFFSNQEEKVYLQGELSGLHAGPNR